MSSANRKLGGNADLTHAWVHAVNCDRYEKGGGPDMRDDLPAGIQGDWPFVRACNENIVPTDEECDAIDNITGGEHPPHDKYQCELADGHRGPHHSLAQIAYHHETWLAWDNDGIRELRGYDGCPLEIPLAQTRMGKTTTCNLFHGHVGPHPCLVAVGGLWWWGDCDERPRRPAAARFLRMLRGRLRPPAARAARSG